MSDPYQNPVPHCSKDEPPPATGPRQLEAFRSVCSELNGLVGTIGRDLSETVAMKESVASKLHDLETDAVARRRLYESCLSMRDEFKRVEERMDRQEERIRELLKCEKSVDARQSFIDERKKIFDY